MSKNGKNEKSLGYIDMAQFLKEVLPSDKYSIKVCEDRIVIHRHQKPIIEFPPVINVSPLFILGCGLFMAEGRKGAQEGASSFYGMDLSPAEVEILHFFIEWTKTAFGVENLSAEIGYDQKIEDNLKKVGISINDVKERFLEEFPMIEEEALKIYKRKEHKGGLTFTICYRERGTKLLLDVSTILSFRVCEFLNGMISKPSWLSVSEDISKPLFIIDTKKWIDEFRYGKEPGLHQKNIYWITNSSWECEKNNRYIILDEKENYLIIRKEKGKKKSTIFVSIPIYPATLTQAALYVGEGVSSNLAISNKDPRIIIMFIKFIESISPHPNIRWGAEVRVWWFFDCLSESLRNRILKILESVRDRHERTEMVNVVLHHLKKDLYKELSISKKVHKTKDLDFDKINKYKKEALELNKIIATYKNNRWIDIAKFHELENEVLDRIKRNLTFPEGGTPRPWAGLSLSLYQSLSKYPKTTPFVIPAGLNTDFQRGCERKEYIGLRILADSTLNELIGKCQTGPYIFNKSLSYALVTDMESFISRYGKTRI